MDIYTFEVHTGRRAIHTERRELKDVNDPVEVSAAFDAILTRLRIPGDGLTLRIYTVGRRPRLLREVTR